MKKRFLSLFFLISPFLIFAQEQSTSEKIDTIFKSYTHWFVDLIFYAIPFSDTVQIPWVLIVLVGGATYFTVVRGDYDDIDEHGAADVHPPEDDLTVVDGDLPETIKVEGHHGEVSHFQALTAALSATVGLGNIAGVAVAIAIGGPGATFWMILAGLLGMASKFAECTLGVKYRDVGPDGTVYGGPMYYLSKGLKEKGLGKLGKVLSVFFAVMVIGGSFGGGNYLDLQMKMLVCILVSLWLLLWP